MGEVADGSEDGGEAVAAGGGERAVEAEGLERVDVVGGDFGGGGVVEEIGEEQDEGADERRVGVGAEVTAVGADFRDEPDLGGAAGDAVRGRALGRAEGRAAAGAVDDGGEAFLRIVVKGELFEQGLLSVVEPHADGERAAGPAKIQAKLAVYMLKTRAT